MARRPLQWLDDASPEEIAEALLAVDQVKAYQVATYLGTRLGPEMGRLVQSASEEIERDPIGTLGGALLGALQTASRGRKG